MAQMVKNPPAMWDGHLSSIPGLGIFPGRGYGNPLQFSCGESHGQRSLEDYSPWGRKESDMTEQLSTCTYACVRAHTYVYIYKRDTCSSLS